MSSSDNTKPLYVDLDGTLIKSDMTLEAILLLLRKNVFYLALMPFWLWRGIPNFKRQLALRTPVPTEYLPLNEDFLEFLKAEKALGREIVLISASEQSYVEAVAERVGLFDRVEGTNSEINLKGSNKLERINALSRDGSFDYAGNSSHDLPIWARSAQPILVNCGVKLGQRLDHEEDFLHFDLPDSSAGKLLRAMRPHQWLKNSLVFVALILSHQLGNPLLLLQASLGFLSFCLCASSVYLLNDLFDLESDRRHPSKCRRPFASGELSLHVGFVAAPLLLLAAFAIALLLPLQFLLILASYWVLTFLYSLFLKRVLLLDVVVLAMLYTLRIVAGAAAIAVVTTPWLIAFSLSLFLGLAIVKRVTELTRLGSGDEVSYAGRAYKTTHRRFLLRLGVSASSLAVAVFAFYINAPETTRLYSSPALLWLICPLLLLLLVRIWQHARTGSMEEDPLVFAIGDHLSQGLVLLCGVIIWLAI